MWVIPETRFNIPVLSDPDLYENCCHYNVETYVKRYGGTTVLGAYVLKHICLPYYYLVEHSVWQDGSGSLIDITPFSDSRTTQFFVQGKLGRCSRLIQSPVFINIPEKQEVDILYYIYCYFDENDIPFYIGKGSKTRAYDHLRECWKDKENNRFYNKLKTLLTQGKIPNIKFLVENIEVETHAYDLEEEYIKTFGRIGYEDSGTLLNTCPGSKPPSLKNKTYQEIYGNRWEEEVEKRRKVQLDRGGFGPEHHSDETKLAISLRVRGEGNRNFNGLTEEDTLKLLGEFCVFFNNEISPKKWFKYCERSGIGPNFKKSFRFGGKDLLEVAAERYNAVVDRSNKGLLWFHNPSTLQTFRCFQWELDYNFIKVPDAFIAGRGGDPWKSKLKKKH